MKTRILSIVTIALTMAVSCAKEESRDKVTKDGFVNMEFKVASEDTKTILSGDGSTKTVEWVKGDEVDIFWDGGSTTSQAAGSGATTTFRAEVPTGTDLYAAYPSGSSELVSGTLSVTIPEEQDGTFGNCNYAVSKLSATETSTFYNAASFFKFEISDENITKVVISSVDGEDVTGKFDVAFNESGIVASNFSETSSSVTVNVDEPGTYYAAVIPGSAFESGVTLVCYNASGSVVSSYFLDKNILLPRAVIGSFGSVEERIGDFYVSVAGSGDKSGKDWSNAMDKDAFKQLVTRISSNEDHRSRGMAAKLNGRTVFIAGGTYDLGEMVQLGFNNDVTEYVSFTFDGSYNPSTGEKDTSNPTVFTGNDNHTIFELSRYTELSACDVNFVHSSSSNGGYAAVRIDSYYSAKLHLTRCTFSDNVNSATAAALSVGRGYADLKDCTFTGNQATYAAAINLDGGALTLDGCRFSGNAATTEVGGAIRAQSGGPLSATNCTFEDNTARQGGALYCANVAASFVGCNFGTSGHGNTTTSSGGACRIEGAEVNFTNCNFEENSGLWGAALSYKDIEGNSSVITGCHFTGNTASKDGGAIMADEGAFTISGSFFDSNNAENGGAISLTAGVSMTVTDTDFGRTGNNEAAAAGGTLYFKGSCTPSFTNCYFKSNSWTGGVLETTDSSHPMFDGCTFDGSQASKGGAVYCGSTSYPSFTNCTFSGCFASSDNGGAVYMNASANHPSFSGCTFSGNYTKASTKDGGAIFSQSTYTSGISIDNCTFTENYSTDDGGTIFCGGTNCIYNISGCTFNGNHGVYGGVLYVGSGCTANITGGSCVENYASGAGYGGVLYGGGSSTIHCNGVIFDANYAVTGAVYAFKGNNNVTAFFNGCTLKHNHWSSTYGCLMSFDANRTGLNIAFNNCSIFQNYIDEAANPQTYQSTWFNLNQFSGTIMFSNSTIWGRCTKGPNEGTSGDREQRGFIRVNSTSKNALKLVNTIVANSHSSGKGFTANVVTTVDADWSLLGYVEGTNGGGITWNGSNNGIDVRARGDWFGYSAKDNWVEITQLKGSANITKGTTSNINSKIQTQDGTFYTWLQGIGALGKDCRGYTRGTASWPGAYDNGASN